MIDESHTPEAEAPESEPAPAAAPEAKAPEAAKKPGPKPKAKNAAKAAKPAKPAKAPKAKAPEPDPAPAVEASDIPHGTALLDHEDPDAGASYNGIELARGKKGLFLVPLAAVEPLVSHGFKLIGAGE